MSRPRLLDLFCGAGGAALVTPDQAVDDLERGLVIDPIFAGQRPRRLAGAVAFSNAPNLRPSEFGRRVAFSGEVGRHPTGLLAHVRKILSLGAQPQVRRVAAGRVVARMHHDRPLGDWAVVDLPANAMGFQVLPESAHLPVASGAARRTPLPARVVSASIHMAPELNVERLRVSHG